MANDELRNLQQRRAEQKALLDEMLKGKTDEERLIVKQKKEYRDILNILKEVNEQVNEIQSDNKIILDNLIQQESKLKGLTGIQASLVNLDRKRITAQQTLNSDTQNAINSIASMNQELLAMSAEDAIGRKLQKESIDAAIKSLMDNAEVSEEILQNLVDQSDIANKISGLTEKQQKFLNKQLEVYEGIKDAIGGVLETASLLTSTMGGMVGISLIGLGKIANAAGEVRSQLGGISDIGTTALSFIDDNAVENIKSLSDEFGGISNVSTELQASTSLIAANMGISGGEAASLLGSFSRLNGNSQDVALDMTKTTQEFAKQNGIIPSKLMADLASSAEAFALYGKDGGENILRAAGYAQKLGVNMNTITNIADNLLDFESSITKELELSAMLGKNINLDRARALAYAGKLEEATAETLKAMGGIDAFNKMDPFAKRAAADLLGIQLEELQKMVTQQENADTLGASLNEKFSIIGETLNTGLNKYLGTSLQAFGGMLIAGGQMSPLLKDMGINMGGMIKSTAQVLKNLLGMVAGPVLKGIKSLASPLMDSFGGTAVSKGLTSIKDKLLQGVGGKVADVAADAGGGIANKLKDKAGDKLEGIADDKIDSLTSAEGVEGAADSVNKDKSMGDKLKDLSKGLKAMGNTQVLFGALNLIPTALGFIAVLPGIPGMLAIAAIGVPAAVGLRGLASGLKAFGKAAPEALIGIGLLALFGVALIPFTYALSLLAPLVVSIGTAIGDILESIGKGIASIVTSIGDLLVKVLPLLNLEAAVGILAMAAAFSVLAGSLALLGTIGSAALPVLLAVGAVGAIGSMLLGGEESAGAEGGDGGGSMSALLDEIKGLRADLNSGKVAVYLDGKKVTSTVARVANTSSTNTYAKR